MDKYLRKTSSSKQKETVRQIKRKYRQDYIHYGFIASGPEDHQQPLCIICNTILKNESLVPSKLMRHLSTKHPTLKDKPIEFFENWKMQTNKQAKKMDNYLKLPENGLIASYKVAHLLAKRKKAHTDVESVIAPALAIVVEEILGTTAAQKVRRVPLSNDTISRRIKDLSTDLQDQIREHFIVTENELSVLWALQVDESTDRTGKAHLLAFIRFTKNLKLVNELLFCKELDSTTTGEDIFELVNENVLLSKLKWSNCVSVCTDGCPSMQGKNKGFVTYVRQKNPNVVIVHCMVHREALVAKSLPKDLQTIMNQVCQVVNFIKSRPLRNRLFSQLCKAMDSEYECLLYHTEVRWLSKGKVLKRLVQLKTQVLSFMETQKKDFGFSFNDEMWWLKVLFLSDLFEKLNNLNSSLQGPSENIITSTSKLRSLDEKLTMWKTKVSMEIFDSFPSIIESPLKKEIVPDIMCALNGLQQSLRNYFPEFAVNNFGWTVNLFGINNTNNFSTEEEEQLIDLRNDVFFQALFPQKSLDEFWLSVYKSYPTIGTKAIKILLPFASSWLCEYRFSALTEIKSKKRERLLGIDDEMQVCLTMMEPRFDLICSQKQAHSSH